MNADFPRVLLLLRQEKKISQRAAAADLGISQALLSHYENGIREPGLAFVARVCDYYHVSADYLLGRTMTRDGAIIEAEELVDASQTKENLRGSIQAKLQKKLVVNTVSVLYDLLGRLGSREVIGFATDYLCTALYQLYRHLYRQAGVSECFFSLDSQDFDMDVLSAEMTLSRIGYVRSLQNRELEDKFPPMDSESMAENYPGLSQSVAQVLHTVDEQRR